MSSYQNLLTSFAQSLFGKAKMEAADIPAYDFRPIDEVWAEVKSDPYASLPQEKVSVAKCFSGLKDVLLENSRRTLADRNDIIPYFDKLVHPNGICLKGTWNITEANSYSGAFQAGTAAPFIARASTALSNTRTPGNRAFGFAGKIFGSAATANFFAIHDLGGTRKKHFLDTELTNDLIIMSPGLNGVIEGLVGLTAGWDFPKAEGSNLQTALIRELYPISELDLPTGEAAVTPIWLKISTTSGMPRIDEPDFRDELRIEHYPNGLRFDISVASEGSRLGPKAWHKIGHIQIDDTVASASCDHRLHFAHPKARKIY